MLVNTALIGLREGLEAGLVVTILVAFLKKSDNHSKLSIVRDGVICALVVAVAAGAVLTFTAAQLSDRGQELFAAVTSLAAVAMVTGMIFWMRHPVQAVDRQLRGQMSDALRIGGFAVFMVPFIAVLREGLEAAIFVLVAAQGADTGTLRPLASFLGGLAVAIVLTWLIYQGAVRIDFRKFFTATGFLLIFVAAGFFGHGFRDFQQAGVLPGEGAIAFDVSGALPLDTIHGSLLYGIFSISTKPTILEVLTWAGYLIVVVTLFVRAMRMPREVAPYSPIAAPPASAEVQEPDRV